jgi:hypothetical protein
VVYGCEQGAASVPTHENADASYMSRWSPAATEVWVPPSNARRITSLRRLIQNNTKRNFWDELLEATCTPTPLHQDEYEEPREIKTFRINRIKANTYTHAKIAGAARTSATDRLRASVFGQLHREMRGLPGSSYRRAYVGKVRSTMLLVNCICSVKCEIVAEIRQHARLMNTFWATGTWRPEARIQGQVLGRRRERLWRALSCSLRTGI